MGILLLGLGLFAPKPAEARNAVDSPQSYTIAQTYSEANSPLYGSWKLTYSIDGVVYESYLVMNGYEGGMGTTYYNPNLRRTRIISQHISLKSSSQGLVLIGSSPTDYDTKKPAPEYSPDNFLLSIRPDGSFLAINCDRAGRCSDVDMQAVK